MAICTQFNTAQLKGMTFKLQCCLGQVAKKYARLRAAGRLDLAKCEEYDLKYLTLAYNALNCIDSLDYTLPIIGASFPIANYGKQANFTTFGAHNMQLGQLVTLTGFTWPGFNNTAVPVIGIRSLNEFAIATPNSTYSPDLAASGTLTVIMNNSLSCDDIQAILDKVKSICECDCCPNENESIFQMTYNQSNGTLSANPL